MPAATSTVVRVSDIMTREPITVEQDATLREVAQTFEDFEISGAPVVDAGGRVVGVVSKTDLIRRCMEGIGDQPPGYLFEMLSEETGEDMDFEPDSQVVVQDFMSSDPITARPEEPIGVVARRLAEARVHRAIVIDTENMPIGIVTSLDILGAFPQ